MLLLAAACAHAGDLLWPLPDGRYLTGGYADSRPDHFHGGIDLRTGPRHLPVVAPTDGWIERIAVSPGGYGRAIYLRMTDGRTAVYAHLHEFVPPLERLMRAAQLRTGTYRMDTLFFESAVERAFRRGDTLAFTGSSGSGPPHLHFEIREGAIQTDPLANYEPRDHQRPVITAIRWVELADFSHETSGRKWNGGEIRADSPVALLIQTYDPGPWGRHAVPACLRVRVNESVAFEDWPSRIDLHGTRNIYSKIVWPARRRDGTDIRRLFHMLPPPARLDSLTRRDGWLAGLDHAEITIEVEDRAGNVTSTHLTISCGPWPDVRPNVAKPPLQRGQFRIHADHDPVAAWAILENPSGWEIRIEPSGLAFGDRVRLTYCLQDNERLPGLYFYERRENGSRKPLWRLPDSGTEDTMACWILRAGTYGVAEDHEPPRLVLSGRSGKLRFSLSDDESAIDDSAVRCRVNGITAVAEYEPEENGGAIWTAEPLRRGTHDVWFEAADRAGNVRTWQVNVDIP